MRNMRRLFSLAIPVVAAAALPTSCGSSGNGPAPFSDDSGACPGCPAEGGSGDDSGDGGIIGSKHKVVSLAIMPLQAVIQSLNGAAVTQQFTAVATFDDGSNVTLPNGVSWSRDNPQVGAVDGKGLYTANGSQGGVVNVSASYMGQNASATLLVKLHLTQNPGNVPGNAQQALQGAGTLDASVVWAYPYDGTVFPRGVAEAPLMWTNGGATDDYYVHLTSATFELESYATAPMSRYDFDANTWQQFLDSTSGAAELKVARWNGQAATVISDLKWTVGPASMRGTIYYWAINTGRVMRIKALASQPDDFLGASVTCPSCHTVSANGQQLVMNEGTWPQETSFNYDLQTSANTYSGLSSNNNGASQWALAGVSADGSVVVENFSPLRGGIGQQTGAFDATSGSALSNTGLEGKQLCMPAFAPDDKLLAYTDCMTHDLRAYDWDSKNKVASNDRLIMAAGGDPNLDYVSFPTVSPDHQWIVYQRSSTFGSLGNPADLYVASVANPGTEVALDALNGKIYPFAAGDRDRHLDYEPTFAPVAAGGYFWVVFHSRRTWGNALTGPAYVQEGQGTKQLWVAAFDQSPKSGSDPSHAAFYLPGQDSTTLNMRGYWALDPCKGNGQGCQSGVECCGGYCGPAPDGGLVCSSSSNGCSQDGDKCMQTSDCCGAMAGTQCINGVCSEPPPQ